VIDAAQHLIGGAHSALARNIIVQEHVVLRAVFMPEAKIIFNGRGVRAGCVPMDMFI
jgi:hypothetical protein